MPGIFVAQLPQRCDLQESFDGRWAEPLYNILIREVRGLVPPYSRQRSIERRHFLHLQTPTMEHYTYNNGLMQAVVAVASCRPIPILLDVYPIPYTETESVPIEAGEENVSEKRVREAQFWALGFSGNRRKGYAVENLAGGLKTETVRYKLSVAREFKMEIPARMRT